MTREINLNPKALDDITLHWMLKRVLHYFKEFPIKPEVWRGPTQEAALAEQHEPRKWIYRTKPFAWRAISNDPIDVPFRQLSVSFDRHQVATGEMLHIAALERLDNTVKVDGKEHTYTPKNLTHILDRVRDTYSENKPSGMIEIPIVNWSGDILDPGDGKARKTVLELLGRPGVGKMAIRKRRRIM
jgi:hypothetical protein